MVKQFLGEGSKLILTDLNQQSLSNSNPSIIKGEILFPLKVIFLVQMDV